HRKNYPGPREGGRGLTPRLCQANTAPSPMSEDRAMRRATKLWVLLLGIAGCPGYHASPPGGSAKDIAERWRRAVHAGKAPSTAALKSTSNEDGVPAQIEERVTSSGAYRATIKRSADEAEIVLSDRGAARRDWNGFVREVRGQELRRLRTLAF